MRLRRDSRGDANAVAMMSLKIIPIVVAVCLTAVLAGCAGPVPVPQHSQAPAHPAVPSGASPLNLTVTDPVDGVSIAVTGVKRNFPRAPEMVTPGDVVLVQVTVTLEAGSVSDTWNESGAALIDDSGKSFDAIAHYNPDYANLITPMQEAGFTPFSIANRGGSVNRGQTSDTSWEAFVVEDANKPLFFATMHGRGIMPNGDKVPAATYKVKITD